MNRTTLTACAALAVCTVSYLVDPSLLTVMMTPIKLPPLGYPVAITRGAGKSLMYELVRDKWGQIEDRTLRVRNKGGMAWTDVEITLTQGSMRFTCTPVATVPAHELLEIGLVACLSDQSEQPIALDRPVRGLRIVADEGTVALNIEPGIRIAPVK